MNVFINEAYLKTQRANARRFQLYGILLVVASFIGSLMISTPGLEWFVLLSYPALIVGFPLWQVGRGRSRRWTEEAKLPAFIAAELKGVSTKHTLYSYVQLPSGPVIDYLVVGPDGFYVVEMKTGGFPVTVTKVAGKDKWTQKLPFLERLARVGEEPLANPSATLEANIAALKQWVADNKLASPEAPVYGVVVFRDPKTTINADESEFEALHLDELKSFILTPLPEEEQQSGAPLPTDERNRLNVALRTMFETAAPATPAAAKPATPAKVAPVTPPRNAPAESKTTVIAPTNTKPNSAARTSSAPNRNGATPPTKRSGTSTTPRKGS